MKLVNASIISLLAVMAAVPAHAQERAAVARLVNGNNETVATAHLTETGSHGVLIELDVTDLPPGSHGFHIHEVGMCAPDFEAAGDHFNPDGRTHGLFHARGQHAGDLLNIDVPPSGSVRVERLAFDVTLEPGVAASLFDADGSALVIHEGADDYSSQPSGDSGNPIACGVIRR